MDNFYIDNDIIINLNQIVMVDKIGSNIIFNNGIMYYVDQRNINNVYDAFKNYLKKNFNIKDNSFDNVIL